MSDEVDVDDLERWVKLETFGLHKRPLHRPLGDQHHTDVAFTREDEVLGNLLAWFMGDFTADIPSKSKDCYCYTTMTSREMWQRVARALRIHGLKLSNRKIKKTR